MAQGPISFGIFSEKFIETYQIARCTDYVAVLGVSRPGCIAVVFDIGVNSHADSMFTCDQEDGYHNLRV